MVRFVRPTQVVTGPEELFEFSLGITQTLVSGARVAL